MQGRGGEVVALLWDFSGRSRGRKGLASNPPKQTWLLFLGERIATSVSRPLIAHEKKQSLNSNMLNLVTLPRIQIRHETLIAYEKKQSLNSNMF